MSAERDDKMFERFITSIASDIKDLKASISDSRDEMMSVRESMMEMKSDIAVQARMVEQVERLIQAQNDFSIWRSSAELRIKSVEKERDELRSTVRKMIFTVLTALITAAILGGVALQNQ